MVRLLQFVLYLVSMSRPIPPHSKCVIKLISTLSITTTSYIWIHPSVNEKTALMLYWTVLKQFMPLSMKALDKLCLLPICNRPLKILL